MTNEPLLEIHGKMIAHLFEAVMSMNRSIGNIGIELLTLRSALQEKHIVTGEELDSIRAKEKIQKVIDLTLDSEMQKALEELKADWRTVIRAYHEAGLEPPSLFPPYFFGEQEEGRG